MTLIPPVMIGSSMTTKFSRIPATMLPAKGATICDGLSDRNCHVLGSFRVTVPDFWTFPWPRRLPGDGTGIAFYIRKKGDRGARGDRIQEERNGTVVKDREG